MYKLQDCIRVGLIAGALFGAALETWVALKGNDATAVEILIRSAYGIAHAAVAN
jgi:hypothetical protein